MEVLNILERDKAYFTASETPELVNIQTAIYLTLEGTGSPGSDIFYQKKHALRVAAQQLKTAFDKTTEAFEPSVVEIFYWYNEARTGFVDIGEFYTKVPLSELYYRMAIKIPEYVTDAAISSALEPGIRAGFSYFKDIRRYEYTAGPSVQILHNGPFSGELQTLPRLQQYAGSVGYIKNGMHHEIHLTHFERGMDQTHMRTILRDPVRPVKNEPIQSL